MLSYKVVNMAGKILERMDILQVAKPYMERLSDLSGSGASGAARGQSYLIYTRLRRRSERSAWYPMWEWYIRCTAPVSAKRSWRRFRTRKSKRSGMRALLRKTRTRRSRIFTDAGKCWRNWQNGYALDDEENEKGVRCIAACLHGYQKEVKYAFSISGPTSRMTRERVKELAVDVKKVQEELSKRAWLITNLKIEFLKIKFKRKVGVHGNKRKRQVILS